MPSRRIHVPIDFDDLRAELKTPDAFPPEVLDEAGSVQPIPPAVDRTDIPFVTVDPPGSKDLDQAVHLSATDGGHLVRYAIADVSAFVRSGGAIETEARKRGQTLYFPDGRVPLHPPALSEGAASLLPGVDRPAVLWTIALSADGEVTDVGVERALVRSTAQLDYPSVQRAFDAGSPPPALTGLDAVGRARAERAVRRGAIELALPEQEVDADGRLTFRAPLPVEEWNAQISLLTGQCAAAIMLAGRVGLLRTLPPPAPRDVEQLRRSAPALGIAWPDGASAASVVRDVDRSDPRGAAFLDLAAVLLRGAAYTAFDGTGPAEPGHGGVGAPYAHVTAPLRRLVDRYATEVCLALHAGTELPVWTRLALPVLPQLMAASDRRAHEVDRAVVDLAECVVLAGRVGDVFEAAVVDVTGEKATVMVTEPAVRATAVGPAPPLGTLARVRLTELDPATRRVRFTFV